jgi:FKBP-type peptidyl-prolyl cis-trans isomerase (trigger factor)
MTRQRLKQGLLDKLAERYDFPVPPGMVEMEFNSIWAQYEADKERQNENAPEHAAAAAGSAGEGPIDAAAAIAPEETALEGASDRVPPSTEVGSSAHQTHAHQALPPEGSAQSPIDAAAIVAPEETALEGASDAAAAAEVDEDEEKAKAEFRRIAERRVRLGLLLAEVGRNNNITVSQEELNGALAQEARRVPGYERQVIDYYRKNPDAVNHLRAPIFEEKIVDFIVEMAKPGERKVTPQELMTSGADGAPDGATAPAA